MLGRGRQRTNLELWLITVIVILPRRPHVCIVAVRNTCNHIKDDRTACAIAIMRLGCFAMAAVP
jgi:hypothetical protein